MPREIYGRRGRRGTLTGALVGPLVAAGLMMAATPALAQTQAGPPPETYRLLDTVPDQAQACSDAHQDAYESGDAAAIREAKEAEIVCLIGIAADVAARFYPPDAFGPDGIRGLLTRALDPVGRLYRVIQTDPAACTPACGSLYGIQAVEAEHRFVSMMLFDMVERLKDESPFHMQ